MSALNRRQFLGTGAGVGLLVASPTAYASPAATVAAMSLREALEKRRSIRAYEDTPIDEAQLSELLWSAYGINRKESGGRTAPSWHSSYGTDIFVADAGGARKFEPVGLTFIQQLRNDIRAAASPQPFVATAPTVLVFVSDLERMYDAPQEERVQAAHVDAGIIAQNIYLYCAAAGLGTCLVGGADKVGLANLLGLPKTQIVTFVQPVGHPRQRM